MLQFSPQLYAASEDEVPRGTVIDVRSLWDSYGSPRVQRSRIEYYLRQVHTALQQGEVTVVCSRGQSRAPTVCACYLLSQGSDDVPPFFPSTGMARLLVENESYWRALRYA